MNLKQKIQKTKLFADSEKIALLVKLDELSVEDKSELESVIDRYDAEYKASVTKLTDELAVGVDKLASQAKTENQKQNVGDAAASVALGLGIVSSDSQRSTP